MKRRWGLPVLSSVLGGVLAIESLISKPYDQQHDHHEPVSEGSLVCSTTVSVSTSTSGGAELAVTFL